MPGYISEVDYDGGKASNFVEIVVPASVDTSGYTLVVYGKNGNIIETFSLGAPVNTIAGKNVYLLDNSTPNWVDVHNNEALALVDDSGTVLQFISFKNSVTAVEGPAAGTTSTSIGQHSGANQSLVTSNGGASYSPTTTSTAGTIPCYAPGTRIATPVGDRAVEMLRPGDLVCTLDGEAAEILWVSARAVALDAEAGDVAPVFIRSGAFGPGRPRADLIVSSQHRILAGGLGAAVPGIATETLIPAKALVGLPGIRRLNGRRRITWHHFACARHHVIDAEGCWTESLLLGPMVLNRLSALERKRVRLIFGPAEAGVALNGPLARPCLEAGEAGRLIAQSRRGARRFAKKPAEFTV